ncbi:alpha/beta fold hydrolase [Streptomyces daghestanicus]|uniref:Alpha/beta hydrolase n=1 Tax=Streptomyces daghestanicus TaxID=66885 RepID=A0ABQ3QDZ4_9ACTN|nr:alpha/beta hydrolase [Streptomyces daghestanicus]GGU17344.1 alpha/beta hydrolase [Streptomyces daghestanicus]GHI35470.1 alpha/beta hydrolase [Streptomyces daghestanicus]
MEAEHQPPPLPGPTRYAGTRYGRIAYTDTDPLGASALPPLLFVHGNSASRKVFHAQLADDFGGRRLLALDLPGHGESDDATDPGAAYTQRGYAATVAEFLGLLGIDRVVVVGWSLGGHIGLELVARFPGVAGLVVTGTPPVNRDTLAEGFLPTLGYAGTETVTAAQAAEFAAQITFSPPPGWVVEDIRRTDGRARRLMFESFAAGRDSDQKALVATSPVPLAVIDGRDDPVVHHAYVASLTYAALWRGAPTVLEGRRHAAFLEDPAGYDDLLRAFLRDHGR